MPNYDFKCETCNTIIEVQDSMQPPCTTCGNTMVRVWSAVPIHFKGGGFYKTGG